MRSSMLALVSSRMRQRDGLLRLREERQLLLGAVLVDLELFFVQVRRVLPLAVGGGDVQRHELDAAADPLPLGGQHRGAGGGDAGRPAANSPRIHLAPARPVRVRARAFSPGFVTVTSIFWGGMSVSGRA